MSIFHTVYMDMCANTMLMRRKSSSSVELELQYNRHVWVTYSEGGEGGGIFQLGKPELFGGFYVGHTGYLLLFRLCLFIYFHVGLMKCMLSSFQLLP